MKYSSERVVPETHQNNWEDYLIFIMHKKTYEFASPYIRNSVVLDFGCGEGYGTHMLSSFSQHITGIDVNKDTIAKAKNKYSGPHINFQTVQPTEIAPLPFPNGNFDVILSFQVMEHVTDVNIYLKEICRILKRGGKVIIATPNAKFRLLPFQNPWNKYHTQEFTHEQLKGILSIFFIEVKILGQTLKNPWLKVEKKRISFNKWLLWPFTNKLIPNSIRCLCLRGLGKMAAALKKSFKKNSAPINSDNDPVVILEENIKEAPFFIAFGTKI